MRRRVKEAFAINPPRRFRLPSFVRGRRRVGNPFRSRGKFTGLDQFNAERESDLAMRRYREGLGSGLPTRVRRKSGAKKRRKVSRRKSVGNMKRKMARVRSFIKTGGKKVMARHKRGRPRKRHRITRHFGKRIGVSNVSVLLNRPKRRRRSVVSRHRRFGNPLSVIGLNPHRRHRRSSRHSNPVSSMLSSGGGVMSIAKTIIPLGITAGIGGVVTKLAPGFLGAGVLTNQWARYGAQIGVGVLGCMLVTKAVNKQYGIAFGIGAVAVIAMDLVQGWLLTMTVAPATTTAGIGNASYVKGQYQYPGYPGRLAGNMGAFTKGRITGNAGIGAFSDPYHE